MPVSSRLPKFPGIQTHQFIILSLLVAAGKIFGNIYLNLSSIILLLLAAFIIEHIILFIKNKKIPYISFSVLSTTLGVVLMLASTEWWIYLVVIILSIIQKHMLTADNRHFFNPSNFALIAAISLFYSKSHIITGQLGDELWMRVLVVVLSISILTRVDRWTIPLAFVVFYLILEYFMVVGYDPVMTFEMVYERFYAVSFVVFVVFMLTDPRTTPDIWWQQIIFAFLIAIIAAGLDRENGFRVQHLFMALFVISPWVPATKNSKVLPWSVVIFILALGVIIFIENQPPYYFEMEG